VSKDARREPLPAKAPMMRLWMIVAAMLGLALAVALIVHSGAANVARAMLAVGWGLVPISLYHVVPMVCSALSLRELLPASSRLGVGAVIWMRWIRESVSSLLPVGGVGGDLVNARLAHRGGVPGAQAAASMVVDVTVGVATQLVFVALGLALLLRRSSTPAVLAVAWVVLVGMGAFVVAIAIFLRLQHRGMFAVSARVAGALLRYDRLSGAAGGAAAVDEAVVAIYRRRPALLRANAVRLLGWAAGTGEIWLVMQFLGRPIDPTEAFILESLGAGVRAAAFMVPGTLGVLEGGYVVFGALFGLPAQTALTIALSKRVRELALGVPGLLVWQWVEGRALLRR
jgi:putative membrane protein